MTSPMPPIPSPRPQLSALQKAWLYGSLAMELTASVVGGALTGYFFDQWQDTSPLGTLLFLLAGCSSGFFLLLRGIKQLECRSKNE